MKRLVAIVLGALLLGAPSVRAQQPAEPATVSWQSLSDQQRKLLAKFESNWERSRVSTTTPTTLRRPNGTQIRAPGTQLASAAAGGR